MVLWKDSVVTQSLRVCSRQKAFCLFLLPSVKWHKPTTAGTKTPILVSNVHVQIDHMDWGLKSYLILFLVASPSDAYSLLCRILDTTGPSAALSLCDGVAPEDTVRPSPSLINHAEISGNRARLRSPLATHNKYMCPFSSLQYMLGF